MTSPIYQSHTSPCAVWATEDDLPESADSRAIKPEVLERAFAVASDVLYNITGRRWGGVCDDTYRPCCGCDYGSCECRPANTLDLPGRPVVAIAELKVDGVAWDPATYEVRDRRWLVTVRDPSTGVRPIIPRCQDLTLPTTEVGTVEVSYSYGSLPPQAGITSCAVLAYEFALAWTPALANQCRLPRRVTSITRQGITVAMIDPLSLFEKGLTGIADVDLWTSAVRYGEKTSEAQLYVPGLIPSGRTRTV